MLIGAERTTQGMLFHFRSVWTFPSDLVAIWNAIGGVERWPEWWPSIERVHVIRGPTLPVARGTIAEYRIHSPLGYHLTFRSEVTAFDLGKWIETAIQGNLSGKGRWDFTHAGGTTTAALAWDVAVTRPALARLASLGPVRSTMSWAHTLVMESGERGLRALL
jgi:hypothetical protein